MARHRSYLVRNLDDESFLESFLVSGIAAILLLRFYLYATGFPQVGGKGLHVAHTLWGGVLLLVALVIAFNYLDRDAHRLAAIVGGAGFGIFIDELGKFITSDTNYFFRPAASIIYVIFTLLYLAFRLLERERNVTDREYLVNSIQTFQQAVIRGYDRSYLEKARNYLDASGKDMPLYDHLLQLYESCPAEIETRPSRLQRFRERSRQLYSRLIQTVWFPRAVIAFFLAEALLTLLVALIATARTIGFGLVTNPGTQVGMRTLLKQSDVLFALVASGLVLVGATLMVRSRTNAFRLFKLAMLVSIFLTQPFEFYTIQFVALFGLGFNIAGLLLANVILARERDDRRLRGAGERQPVEESRFS
jgi:hypothetical protein